MRSILRFMVGYTVLNYMLQPEDLAEMISVN